MAFNIPPSEYHDEQYSPNLSSSDEKVDTSSHNTCKRKLLLFTSPFFGVQLAWTIQQIFGVSHLANLGFSDYELPLILLSGPLSGFIAPPIVGALSDNCQSNWGKRKPFMFWGGMLVVVSIILLAMARDAALLLCSVSMLNDSLTATKVIAGAAMYILNFAMQPLSIGLRTHAVDNFGPLEQPLVSLWIGRWSTLGSVFVALTAYTASPPILSLSAISCAVLTLFLMVSLLLTPDFSQHLIRERRCDPQRSQPIHRQLSRTLKYTRSLPPITKKVCTIQLLSWFVWFLVLNYSSPYINENYLHTSKFEAVAGSKRAVARTALIFHTSGFCTSFVLAAMWRPAGSQALAGALHILVRIWRLCLMTVTLWVGALFLGIGSSTRAASLLLGSIGVIFAISNWIPYALITFEISSLREQDSSGGKGQDDTATILAIHNMAMCVPQMVAAGAVAGLFAVLEYCSTTENRVSWVFLLTVPAAVLGAWMSSSDDVYRWRAYADREHEDEYI